MCKIIFGITGPTGTGKSTVSEIFRSFGVDVTDADKVSREVTKPGMPCLLEIADYFGREFITENGELNRRALGAVVFSDSEGLAALTEITHKYIREYIEAKLTSSKNKICAVDGAVLIGSSMEELCSFMVAVTADKDIRKERIKSRDSLSETEAEARIASQPSIDFYKSHARYIIENNGTYDDLLKNTKAIFKKICIE